MLSAEGAPPPPPAPPEPRSRVDDWWERVTVGARARALWNWGAPAFVVLVASITRLWNLGSPHELVFDETFYVKDAWTLVNLGYESKWPDGANDGFASGTADGYLTEGSFVVHPPLGKYLISIGMALLGGGNSVGWRISTAIVGILAVVLIMLIAKKLMGSTLLAVLAGSLLAIDGNAIVMSRVALLDNFVMIFVLLGFGAVLLDREHSRGRLEAWIAQRQKLGKPLDWGPALWWRPWLISAGLAFGLATSVKWNGLYFLAVFAIYTLVVDALARRRAGIAFWATSTILKQAPTSFVLTVPIALVTYLLTWTRWFTTTGGYYRQWATDPGNAATGFFAWVPLEWQSFWHYQVSTYNYHVGEQRPHGYQANPLSWLFMVRPTSMYYSGAEKGQNGCITDLCGTSITGIANPLIWWAATAAILFLLYRLVRFREWQVGLILIGMAAGYLPWLMYLQRTVFQFYTIAFEPFMILGLVFEMGLVLGDARDPGWYRNRGFALVGAFMLLAVVVSVYFWPLWAGIQLDYQFLAGHWWLPTWR
ncbi:phospholipid carrier-dependent glycosyltransferase [Glaciihabitans arcticus]|uniref:Polyprenol-phosphate-mannose--protein mannosyltransferase n=1 Tax=Glaciihabitans arcticus TaxID=2668039 RepID=A0A4Q9GU52_9MICO|nr:phospholipid carrier-dependent glycosyltransferase [Glaciihabitans arcticus]